MEYEDYDKAIIYSLSNLTDQVTDIDSELGSTSIETWIESLGDRIATLLETLSNAAWASEMHGPTFTAEDDVTVDTSDDNEELDFADNPFQLTVNKLGPRLAAYMFIEAIDHEAVKDRGAAHMEGIRKRVERFCELAHDQHVLTMEQMERLIQAQAAVWSTIDADHVVWEIVSRYIKAEDAGDQAEMATIRAQVAPPLKEDLMHRVIHGEPSKEHVEEIGSDQK